MVISGSLARSLQRRARQGIESYRDKLEQKRKRLEAELSHNVYTTQTQFDTEFNAIKDIFAALGKLRLTFNGTRPFVDSLPQDKEERAKLIADRLRHLTGRYNTLIDKAKACSRSYPRTSIQSWK